MTWGRRLTNDVIKAARAHWGLQDAKITLVAARENSVFRIDYAQSTAALRLHRVGYRSDAELRSELEWMAMLAAQGILVPAPIAALDGSQILNAHGVTVDLLTWLDGTPLGAGGVTEKMYFDLGRLTAQMHDFADAWVQPPDFTRPTWDLVGDQPTWDRFWENPALTGQQQHDLLAFRDHARLALDGLADLDTGLIHADLVPDNVLQNNGQLMPIDFDDGGFGHRLFDLATITFRSRRTDPTGALAAAAMAGYCALRDLDKAALPLFEALRACTYVGWNISRMKEQGAVDRNARFIAAAEQAIAAV